MSIAMTPQEAGFVFVNPAAYADDKGFHDACTVLRRESPIHWVQAPEGLESLFNPFYAVTRHADVLEIEAHNTIFLNEPRPVLGGTADDERRKRDGDLLRTLIHVDDPEHRKLRGVTSEWFLPKNLVKLESRIAELAKRYVDKMADMGGECDFVRDIAMFLPLTVILDILGLPEEDYEKMLVLTQQLFGAQDEDMQRGSDPLNIMEVIADFFVYFTKLTEDRRTHPTNDLASVVANAVIDGEPLTMTQTISYYVITATAGHDTTSSAIAGGLLALIENPDQLERLRKDPTLIASAADEIIRWTTPVKHFMRTANEDYEVGGTLIKKGESVLLSYPSANRDELVFGNPFVFDVGRSPNKQLAFGFGVHFCLGAMLARMEIKAILAELIPRLKSIELAGEPAFMKTIFVGGLKRLPIRYQVSAS